MHALPQSMSAEQAVDGTHSQDRGQRRLDAAATGAFGAYPLARRDVQQTRLARTLEAEIIPRLVLAHPSGQAGGATHATAASAAGHVSAGQVEAFLNLVLAADTVAEGRFVEAFQATGASLEMLCAELLAPAARRLGDLWNADQCDFAQVTMAQWRLQHVLREHGPQFPSEVASRDCGLRALLVPAPGEEHTLGLDMVSEFFRRAGWRVSGSLPASVEQLRELVGTEWFDIAGLAISCETRLRLLAQSIRALRQASRNPDIRVLVGGPLFVQRPELVTLVGADATAAEARHAPAQAEHLLALMSG